MLSSPLTWYQRKNIFLPIIANYSAEQIPCSLINWPIFFVGSPIKRETSGMPASDFVTAIEDAPDNLWGPPEKIKETCKCTSAMDSVRLLIWGIFLLFCLLIFICYLLLSMIRRPIKLNGNAHHYLVHLPFSLIGASALEYLVLYLSHFNE